MKKFRAILCLLLALVMVFAFVACAKDDASTDGDKGSSSSGDKKDANESVGSSQEATLDAERDGPDGVQKGTTLEIRLPSDYTIATPVLSSEGGFMYENTENSLVYAYMCNYSDIRGGIAESWEYSDDLLTLTFKIRENATFANGNPINAEAIKACWDWSSAKASSYWESYFTGYEVTGEYEFTCHLKNVAPDLLVMMAGEATYWIWDVSVYDDGYIEGSYESALVDQGACTSGPYNIIDRVIGESISLQAREDFYTPDKQARIEFVTYHVIPDDSTAILAMQSGEIDYYQTSDVESYYTMAELDTIEAIQKVMGRCQGTIMNMKHCPLFQDETVREALAHITDWDAVNDLVYDGLFDPLTSLFSEGSVDWVDWTDKYYYDLEYGTQMLEDAGYEMSDIKFALMNGPGNAAINVAVQGQLLALGCDISIDVVDDSAWQAAQQQEEYDVGIHWCGYNYDLSFRYYTKSFKEGSPEPRCWFYTYDQGLQDEFDGLLAKTGEAKTFDELVEAYKACTAFLQDHYNTFGGIQQYAFAPQPNGLRGMTFRGPGVYLHFYNAYYEE